MRKFGFITVAVLSAMITTSGVQADLWADPAGSGRTTQAPTTKGDPVMTKQYDPAYSLYFGIVPESQIEGHGKTDLIDVGGHWNLGYYRTRSGDWNVQADAHIRLFMDSADLALPSQTGKLFADIEWLYRFSSRASMETHLKPGLYTDFEEFGGDAMGMPFALVYANAVNDSLTLTAGAEIRPSWDREVMPIVGMIWDIGSRNHLQIMLPDSRLSLSLGRNMALQLNFGWENSDYAVDRKHGRDYKQITLEDYTMSLGLTYFMPDGVHVRGEIGQLFDRTIDFKKNAPSRGPLDIEDEAFIRIGIGGPF